MSTTAGSSLPPFSFGGQPAPLYRLSVEQFLRLANTGFFMPEDRVELLDGQVVRMNPLDDRHEVATVLAGQTLDELLPPGWHVRTQLSVRLPQSVPIPDVVIARGAARDYRTRKPQPADIALLVEISDSSLAFDRTEKLRLYAIAGIPEYWIINLVDRQIEIHRQPDGSSASYAQREVCKEADTIAMTIDGIACGNVVVTDLLP
jgi:Uma2 family endonuclease